MEELKIIPEKIWEKIKKDKIEIKIKRAKEYLNVINFINDTPELHYLIKIEKPAVKKSTQEPKVRRRER